MFKLGAAMKLVLVVAALFGVLSAAGVHISVAADMAIIDDELDMKNSLVRCTEPTDCTVVVPTDVMVDQTASARALDLMVAELGTGSSSSDITREGIVALVGDTFDSGMLPSQSVMLPGSGEVGLSASRGESGCGAPLQADTVALSVTVAPIGLGVTEQRAGGVTLVPDIRCDRTIAPNSVTVDRFGHDAGFVRAANRVLPINEFPIAGSNPVTLAFQGVTAVRSYPFKSGSVRH
jgi:hypothetical protein